MIRSDLNSIGADKIVINELKNNKVLWEEIENVPYDVIGKCNTSMIQKEFYELYNDLKEKTQFSSFHDPNHTTFKKLMAMGEPIIPLLLNNLWDSWWAIMGLHTLTRGACQIANQDLGKFDLISQAWYDWGKLEGHI